MNEMTRERFEALAQAYGGDMARWPDAERGAAALLAVAEPAFAQGLLARAGDLDAALDAWRASQADAALSERILAHAPGPRQGLLATWSWRAGLGASLAAACAAGVLLGVRLTPDLSTGDEAMTSVMASFDSVASEDV